jgi:phosphatidylglycerol---prolipoprotein diacylglyceryl transferase
LQQFSIFAAMSTLSYLIWNASPEIFSVSGFALRWYGLLFALGFLISQQILYYIYGKEGKPQKDVDTLTIYMVVATILGARLGHVLFYDPQIIWEDPWGILLPFQFKPEFRFTGLQGLASHGGAIAILFALWLYARKRKPGQSFLQVVDRIVILVALTGALIRLGNFFNSEIIGLPTDSPVGVVFANRLTETLESPRVDRDDIVESVAIKRQPGSVSSDGKVPVSIYVFYKKGTGFGDASNFTKYTAINVINNSANEFFEYDPDVSSNDTIEEKDGGTYAGIVSAYAVVRHAAQLYESIACVILFVLLYLIWNKYREKLPPGRLLGIFLIWCFGLRFLFEYLKENQVSFEEDLPLNMGQILSIPLILAGIVILVMSYRKKSA